MKKKAPRWYRLWFFTSGTWLITFTGNLLRNKALNWIIVIQFLNVVLSFAAGIVNARRYKNRQNENAVV